MAPTKRCASAACTGIQRRRTTCCSACSDLERARPPHARALRAGRDADLRRALVVVAVAEHDQRAACDDARAADADEDLGDEVGALAALVEIRIPDRCLLDIVLDLS